MKVCIGFQGGVWNRLKIREKFRKIPKNSEKIGKIRKNSGKFGKIQKNSEKFGKIQKNLEKFRKNRGTKHKKWGNLWSLEAARAARGRGGRTCGPGGVHTYPTYPQLTARRGCSQKIFQGGCSPIFFSEGGVQTVIQ